MYKITEKVALNPTVTKMVIEAPLIAKKAKPGQFIIVRPFEDSERIPLTVAGYDREKGTVDIIFQIVGGTTNPVTLYAVETAIQMALTECNENLREIYLEAYMQPRIAEQIHRKTAAALMKIFAPYLPECTESDFYELEIGTAGMMCGYMTRPCDIYFTLQRKLERFLHMSLGAYRVPEEERRAVIAFVSGLDIMHITEKVMQTLFSALAMKFDFSLSPLENPSTEVNR